MDIQKILMKLQNLLPLYGRDKDVAGSEIIKDIAKEFYPFTTIEKNGNIICSKKGNGKGKIMILGNLDESGFFIKEIDENGFIRLGTKGNIDEKSILSSELIIHGKKKIKGICGAKPPHLLKPEDRDKQISLENIIVDTGFSTEELSKLVTVGTPVSFDSNIKKMLRGNIAGRNISTKAVILGLFHFLKKLSNISIEEEIIVVFALGGPSGTRGLYSALQEYEPDRGIFLETVSVNINDTVRLGKGPCILKSPIMPGKIVNEMVLAAEKGKHQYQIMVKPQEYNCLSKIPHTYKKSIKAGSILIPVRNIGSPFEIVNSQDIENAGEVLAALIL